jgi:NAD(P)-dependent dehydrogenase (short-subunit alcohol dehydrogenase family)
VQGDLVVKQLDLADLASVRTFAKDVLATEKRIDLLILNAGKNNK